MIEQCETEIQISDVNSEKEIQISDVKRERDRERVIEL